MKKIFSLFIITIMFLLTGIEGYSAVNKQINANIKTKRVPVGTVLTLKILNSVGSSFSRVGDQFDLMVVDNVKVDNVVVIPQGSVIRGSIEEVQVPLRLYKGGEIKLYFDHIVSSTGKQVNIYAGICNNNNMTYDGGLGSHTTYATALSQTTDKTKNIIVTPTSWAWDKGDTLFNGTPKYIMAPVAAIVSTPVAGIYFVGSSIVNLFKRGENINVAKGETLQIRLTKPLDMPIY